MHVDLLHLLSRFAPNEDREGSDAYFKTLVPWVAPQAYLNIVFKPADKGLLNDVSARLAFPEPVVELLTRHNGAMLLSGCLYFYGVVSPGRLLNRRDPFSLPPFNIEGENGSWKIDRDRLLVIGGYSFDGSHVCVDRTNEHVYVYPPASNGRGASWLSVNNWLTSEIARLSALFDVHGRLTVDESLTGPPPPSDRVN